MRLIQLLINNNKAERFGSRWKLIKTRTWGRITANWRKMPDFLIIGAQKAGTTSLFHYLAQHPDLAMPIEKEIHYYDLNFHHGLNWYKQFFPLRSNSKYTGEATPYYLFHPLVAQRIASDMPKVKLIVCLRDPVHRAFSHYRMMKRLGIEWLSFEEAIQQEPIRYRQGMRDLTVEPLKRSAAHQDFTYISRGKYARQIRRWLTYFPRDQFFFLSSEDMAKDPARILFSVYKFLGIQAILPSDLSFKNQGDSTEMAPEVFIKLKQYYRREMQAIEQMTGLTFGSFNEE